MKSGISISETRGGGELSFKAPLVAAIAIVACLTFALIPVADDVEGATATTLPDAVNGVITLTSNVELEKSYTITEDLTIDLAGFDINFDGDKALNVTADNVDLAIRDSTGRGSITVSGHAITSVKNENCTLTIEGGTYSGSFAIIWYQKANTADTTQSEVSISNATIIGTTAGLWVSNGPHKSVELDDTSIISENIGFYCGTVSNTVINNSVIDAVGTAIELKSGALTINDSVINSGSYYIGNTISSSGSGSTESTIAINSGYCKNNKTTEVSLTINNSEVTNSAENSYPIVVTEGVKLDGSNVALTADFIVNWPGNTDKVKTIYLKDANDPATSDDGLIVVNGIAYIPDAKRLTEALNTNGLNGLIIDKEILLNGTVAFGENKAEFTNVLTKSIVKLLEGSIVMSGEFETNMAGSTITVTGDAKVSGSLGAGIAVRVAAGSTLTVPAGESLDILGSVEVLEGARMVINGAATGTITGDGSIEASEDADLSGVDTDIRVDVIVETPDFIPFPDNRDDGAIEYTPSEPASDDESSKVLACAAAAVVAAIIAVYLMYDMRRP